MSFFRINIYLKIKILLSSMTLKVSKIDKLIEKKIGEKTKKRYFIITSQLRVGFMILLSYLKKKFPTKNEIIFSPYNLQEMINVTVNLKFKVKFCDPNTETGTYSLNDLGKKINNKTLAVVITNMFNGSAELIKLKNFCKKKKIILIEDNAIYFDNYSKKNTNKELYSGSFGDYSLSSFNIMKNISALYGGGVATDDVQFIKYAQAKIKNFEEFPKLLMLKQSTIFFILKLFSLNLLYRILFFKIVKFAHFKNNTTLLKLFYPSLKFTKKNFPKFYFCKISNLAKKLIYLQLYDKKSRKLNHTKRKNKNIFYQKIIKEKKIKQIKTFVIKDNNFQNFVDFPILVSNKDKLNKYLLKNGIETKIIHYKNCAKIFNINKNKYRNAEMFEKSIICLPNHSKINEKYMLFMINKISQFYTKY